MQALLAGAATAVREVPPAIAPLISFDSFNESALQFLNNYRFEVINGINATTAKQVQGSIDLWIRSGEPLSVLIDRLKQLPFSSTRAEAIAITEVTRVFAEGNIRLWQSTGLVTEKRWQTAMDERVCPICAPLHNQVVSIETSFAISGEALLNEATRAATKSTGTVFRAPPAHTRCRCWLQPVVSEAALSDIVGDILARRFFADISKAEDMELIHVRYR